jgi:ribosomal protein S18 acetylase RimI-like enzyme
VHELAPMSPGEYDEFIERTLREYIRESARATSMEPEEADKFGRKQFADLLPEGQQTTGQHFRKLRTSAGEVVGDLWFAEQPPRVFIYDLVIDTSQRGRGIGSAAPAALEEEARRLGATEIALHVFSHNTGAIRLYERLGYEAEISGDGGQRMSKAL